MGAKLKIAAVSLGVIAGCLIATYFALQRYGNNALVKGDRLRDKEEHDQAAGRYIKALKVNRLVRNYENQLHSYWELGSIYRFQKDNIKALNMLRQGITVCRRINKEAELPRFYTAAGNACIAADKYAAALEYMKLSLEIYDKTGSAHSKARVLNSIGGTYILLDDYNEALKYTVEAYTTGGMIRDTTVLADAALNLGIIRFKLKDNGRALEDFKMAHGFYMARGDTKNAALSDKYIGKVREKAVFKSIQELIDSLPVRTGDDGNIFNRKKVR